MMTEQSTSNPDQSEQPERTGSQEPAPILPQSPTAEIGGFSGPEPTRYGDWEKNGRCVDF
ncbi:succinate dehydrogenase assembly factor 4 [Methylomicrobium sp. Wu6]|uniref:DUF1674 domain-containing protein n=1 Tax=Methylomicrobium sp. Wu6 TaxID=3107928 RepID=UPI002DD63934|nr:succinate dehydrogenase assembly factor 4 [Methylomicrobium sp. Wu6]MEC4749963.1 DUF1674 domain-containing protein [Methylomicrobium sp. Wu6]